MYFAIENTNVTTHFAYFPICRKPFLIDDFLNIFSPYFFSAVSGKFEIAELKGRESGP
jgi:hypothetical protein